ncbi:Smr/MutS family protein [Allopontixanthobacter sp.]|uniref:Smr/MutS family protein n=1 Tax=Allopontixanthobacter sp. TaxID=2906452 RepID=UPI002ABB4832|nr:Smr/MutS family protein [Allopontixanthobacter sp.]MDZ4307687.1 Smr/MutS family protein [Allopontixanthobacter sp.]
MKPPRGLSAEEAEAWARVAASVVPLVRRRSGAPLPKSASLLEATETIPAQKATMRIPPPPPPQSPAKLVPVRALRPIGTGGLDSHWDKRLKAGSIDPDFTLDLHGHGLDAAHGRLENGIGQARAMGARLVLVVTGKPRPVDAADRADRRGAIRSKILDWLAAGQHADAIAAIRKSHRRHGGDGAIYIVLRK